VIHLQIPQDFYFQGEAIDVESVINQSNQRGMGTIDIVGEESMAANLSRN
jgi:Tfp pilus assembly ATPase PilU